METHADKERVFAIAKTRADVFLAVRLFYPLCTFWSRFRENEWTLYPGLNLKHTAETAFEKLGSGAPRNNFSSYRDAPTELLQKRLLTNGDKRSVRYGDFYG